MLHLFYKTLAVIILLLLFFVAGGGVSQNDRWRTDHIDIVGANAVSAEAMRALAQEKLIGNYFFVYARENSFLFPRTEIGKALLGAFPRLKTATGNRFDVHTIVITVSERKPYALWCGDEFHSDASDSGDCWFIDEEGFVFDRAPVFSEGVYLKVYGTLIEKNVDDPLRGVLPVARFVIADTFVKLIRSDIGEPARIEMKDGGETEITILSSSTYPFFSGVTVRFKDGQDPAVLMKNLHEAIPVQFPENIALKKKLLYLDMRFDNKIFFGFE